MRPGLTHTTAVALTAGFVLFRVQVCFSTRMDSALVDESVSISQRKAVTAALRPEIRMCDY